MGHHSRTDQESSKGTERLDGCDVIDSNRVSGGRMLRIRERGGGESSSSPLLRFMQMS